MPELKPSEEETLDPPNPPTEVTVLQQHLPPTHLWCQPPMLQARHLFQPTSVPPMLQWCQAPTHLHLPTAQNQNLWFLILQTMLILNIMHLMNL